MNQKESLITNRQRQRLESAVRAAALRVIQEQKLPVRLGPRRTACFGPGVEYIGVQIVPPGHIGAEGTAEELTGAS